MSKRPCFANLDHVFPMGENGLREAPPECLRCPDRTECLRAAMKTEAGLRMQEDLADRNSDPGFLGRIRRWSRKKELQRLARERKRGSAA